VSLGPANVSISENQVSNYARGISLFGPQCTGDAGCVVKDNVVHDNFGENACSAIQLGGVSGYTVTGNGAVSNGGPPSCFPNAGITLSDGSTGNVVTRNDSSNNRGFGIAAGPGTNGNLFTNNTARANTVADLCAFPGTENTWLDNNRCNTESGAVPSSVCNPSE
jgi:parallel beta-helix repeat protein